MTEYSAFYKQAQPPLSYDIVWCLIQYPVFRHSLKILNKDWSLNLELLDEDSQLSEYCFLYSGIV